MVNVDTVGQRIEEIHEELKGMVAPKQEVGSKESIKPGLMKTKYLDMSIEECAVLREHRTKQQVITSAFNANFKQADVFPWKNVIPCLLSSEGVRVLLFSFMYNQQLFKVERCKLGIHIEGEIDISFYTFIENLPGVKEMEKVILFVDQIFDNLSWPGSKLEINLTTLSITRTELDTHKFIHGTSLTHDESLGRAFITDIIEKVESFKRTHIVY